MKRKQMILSAVAAGMIFAGAFQSGAVAVMAEQFAAESGIRAKAPQQSITSDADAGSGGTEAENGQSRGGAAKQTAELTEEQAKEIALADADLTEEELTGIRVKLDWDDGRLIYEVDMYVDAEEYSYELDAASGAILESDYEVDREYDNVPSDPDALTKEEASAIVLEKVEGATEKDLRIKYELDDGREIYEGDIVYEQREYEFELNAKTGELLEWSEEKY